MEWVETTGRTLEDARDAALDKLGVDEIDAEFEVLDEPKVGLFGRLRTEGRVRARVRPTAPRAKPERRSRRRSPEEADGSGPPRPPSPPAGAPDDPAPTASAAHPAPASPRAQETTVRHRDGGPPSPPQSQTRGENVEVEVALEEQGRAARDFVAGLLTSFGLAAAIDVKGPAEHDGAEDSLVIELTGQDLGVLIGPRGATLMAVQDLTRSVVQRRTGVTHSRIHVDVAGYLRKRSEALARFAQQLARDASESGRPIALEPMSASDRKVVHEAVGHVEGVHTVSEGEDQRRHVVIVPDGG